ncbi:hypothetical protein LPJ81_005989, partial [Coemansia sp. IMI 209127]
SSRSFPPSLETRLRSSRSTLTRAPRSLAPSVSEPCPPSSSSSTVSRSKTSRLLALTRPPCGQTLRSSLLLETSQPRRRSQPRKISPPRRRTLKRLL